MTVKEQLLQELVSVPDRLIIETLDFLKFFKKDRSKENPFIGNALLDFSSLTDLESWLSGDRL